MPIGSMSKNQVSHLAIFSHKKGAPSNTFQCIVVCRSRFVHSLLNMGKANQQPPMHHEAWMIGG